MVQNAMLYVWGVIFNGTNWILGVPSADRAHDHAIDVWGECRSISTAPSTEASISIILKRFGAIRKIVLYRRHALRGSSSSSLGPVTPLELTTFGVIMLAVCRHTVLADARRRRRRRPRHELGFYAAGFGLNLGDLNTLVPVHFHVDDDVFSTLRKAVSRRSFSLDADVDLLGVVKSRRASP